ncbi:MAG TPA: flagellar basal-body rod protein FlgF [Anaerolineae bacterium]|nr:flagellar basal-body rod protein FlgF [Anaerolineae bacterium]
MIETIFIGMSGLTSYSSGLRGIANNVANLNTPGFKSSSMQFADMFHSNGDGVGQNQAWVGPDFGHGVTASGSSLNFRQGDLRQTGNTMDLAIEGQGLFVLKDSSGALSYTRAGQFEVNRDGILVDRISGAKVMALNDAGNLVELDISDQRLSTPKPTSSVTFSGNLSSTKANETVEGLTVIDAGGTQHTLTLLFVNDSSTQAGQWKLTLKEGNTTIGTSTLNFVDGKPKADANKLSIDYTPAGQAKIALQLDFSGQVSSFASGTLSTLGVASQDGRMAGELTKFSFNDKGVMRFEYGNGQTVDGPRLALANVESPQLLKAAGNNSFVLKEGAELSYGRAGEGSFGALRAGSLEISNVDLSQEFSDMVIIQRGYQASAQIVSTANDMLQELFGMRR